jgi:type IV secretory pathway component VirB8
MGDGSIMAKSKAIAITELTVDQEQRINSILLIWAITVSCLSMVLASCLVWFMLAHQDVDVRVLTIEDSSKQLVEVKRLQEKIQIGDPLLNAFGERLVTLMYTVDHQTEEARTAELGRYLTQEECDKTNKYFDPDDPESFYSKMREGNNFRQVKVNVASVLNKIITSQGNIIRVEWSSITRHGIDGEVMQQQNWVTTVNMDINQLDFVRAKEAREFGFHLIGFVATKIQTAEII